MVLIFLVFCVVVFAGRYVVLIFFASCVVVFGGGSVVLLFLAFCVVVFDEHHGPHQILQHRKLKR
jgi:hypothetical protein